VTVNPHPLLVPWS